MSNSARDQIRGLPGSGSVIIYANPDPDPSTSSEGVERKESNVCKIKFSSFFLSLNLQVLGGNMPTVSRKEIN